MAKMTISGLQSFVSAYVDSAKQGGAWSATTNNFAGLLDKIGKQITIDGLFNDKLPELDGDELPLGKTIEEYFIDLTLPEAFSGNNSTEGAKDIVPQLPTVQNVVYSYSLGRKKVKTTMPYGNFERGMLSAQGVGEMSAKIMERLQNSQDLYKYAIKKQLLGNTIDKAITGSLTENVAKPVDTASSEAFIKAVKVAAEAASFAHEGDCLAGAGALIGATPDLVLYIKKGVMPSVEVDALAGAFHEERLALPVRIKVVDDFGVAPTSGQATAFNKCYALLIDERAIKLHTGYDATRSSENADGDFINFVRHSEYTGFISKYCYVHVFKEA